MKEFFVQLLKNLYINQNFIWLIFLHLGLLLAHANKVCCLFKITFVIYIIVGISVISSTIAYAIDYWTRRMYKRKCYKLRYEYRRNATITNPPACSCIDKIEKIDKLLRVNK
jgi:hypothetical protein